jgi:hypothetical protein
MAINSLSTNITSLSNLAVINPQKNTGYQEQNAVIPPGSQEPSLNGQQYLFHIEGDNSIQLQSEITDSFIETNSAINDHIALKPERVMVNGFIGELNDVFPIAPAGFGASFVAQKLVALAAYTPDFSASALVALNNVILAYQVAANLVSTVGQNIALGDREKYLTKQAYYFGLFYSAWRNRTLYTIQTPWNKYNNMAIESLRATQDSTTRMITDFEITFKKLRFIDTTVATSIYPETVKSGQLAAQSSATQKQGENTLLKSANGFDSLLASITGSP